MKKKLLYYILTLLILSLVWLIGCGGGGSGGALPVVSDNTVPTITFTPTPALGDVTVRVFESDGLTPVAGAFIAFYTYRVNFYKGDTLPDDTKITDNNGESTFFSVLQGPCRMEVWRSEGDYQNNEASLGAAEGNVGTEGTMEVTAGIVAPTATPTPIPTSGPGVAPPPGSTSTPGPTSISTPHWRVNEKVDNDEEGNGAAGAGIGVDSIGNVCAVWVDSRNEVMGDIYSSYRPLEGSWQDDKRVDDGGAGTWISSPDIVGYGNGNFYAVWADARSGEWDIYFSYSSLGGDWSSFERVDNDMDRNNARDPSIAVDASGNIYAVWKDERGGDSDIYFSYRSSEGLWSDDERVDNGGTSTAGAPSITVDSNGTPCVIWQDYRNGNYDIYFSYRSSEGIWSDDVRVDNDWRNKNAYGPVIGADSSGNIYSIWKDYRNEALDLYFSYGSATGGWTYNQWVNTSGSTAYPDIWVDTSGNVYAVWQDGRSGNYDVCFSYLPSGGSWSSPERVDDDEGTTNHAEQPSMGVDSAGRVYVVWQDNRNENYDIYSAVKE